MAKSEVVIGSFLTTNWNAMLQSESKISRFKAKHAKFVADMKAGDFDKYLRGATVKQLEETIDSWVDRTHDHIVANSGRILASVSANKEAILDFQTDLKRAELLKMGKGTEGMITDKERTTLEAALKTYRNKCLPRIVAECAAKMQFVLPSKKAQTEAIKAQTVALVADEAAAHAEAEANS